jgi:hypothetical protein
MDALKQHYPTLSVVVLIAANTQVIEPASMAPNSPLLICPKSARLFEYDNLG